jgi:hypothetical protein
MHQQLLDALEVMRWMDKRQREEFFDAIRKEFCIHCGRREDKDVCQCQNDL